MTKKNIFKLSICMNIGYQNNNLYFGKNVPTEPLFKCLVNLYSYSDCKDLYLALDTKFPGVQGYTGKGLGYAKEIARKNKFVLEIANRIKLLPEAKAQKYEIRKLTTQYGKEIDVEI